MATPDTQKADAKPISFALLLNGVVVPGSFMNLIIRPEEFNRVEPSRGNNQQTAGKIWVDNFGLGVPAITIQGHTGWRGAVDADGGVLFHRLREAIYLKWHTLRQQQQALGRDPDTAVECVFIDTLNGFSEVISWQPDGFRLRRSRSRPLLYQYTMQFIVLRDAAVVHAAPTPLLAVDNPSLPSAQVTQAALDALSATIAGRTAIAQAVRAAVAPAARIVADLADGTTQVLTAVQSVVAAGIDAYDGVTAPLIYAARQIEAGARNLTQALVEPLALTETIKRSLRDLYGSYSEAYCNLTNAFQPVGQYLDFTALYGASNCSSTTGGRPQTAYASQNPFELLYTSGPAPVTISADMQNALNQANGDALVLNGATLSAKLALTQAIYNGLPKGPAK